jgi:integrase
MNEGLAESLSNSLKNSDTSQLFQNPLLQRDVWHTVKDLELKINEHHKVSSLNFQGIQQDWLKLLAKRYILIRSKRGLSAMYLRNEILYLKKFSEFLQEHPGYNSTQMDNQTFESFEYYLKISGASERAIALNYVALKNFFDLCRFEKWLDISTYWFDGKRRGSPRYRNEEVEYIPEEVWNQLDQHLHHLPEPMQRMVLVIRTTGLRIGELLNLPLNCLRKRKGQWRLRFLTEKYHIEDELPIPGELAVIIKEQQDYIKLHFKETFNNLFCSNSTSARFGEKKFEPLPRIMHAMALSRWLNKLAQVHLICSKDGQIWRFRSHQFRRTVATVMTNAGIRDLIIQKYLRHRSPEMQDYYKHLLKKVLADEYDQLLKEKRYIDISGKVVASYKPQNVVTELMRRKIHQVTTQYGECHRPTLKESCNTINACWQCKHWHTSLEDLSCLQEDFARVQEELKTAEKLGMARQRQGLKADHDKLAVRIQVLESFSD